MGHLLSIAVLLAAASGRPLLPARPRAAVGPGEVITNAGTVFMSASPSTISFAASDPDTPLVAGNSSAAISATVSGGKTNRTWNMTVQAPSSSFTNCGQLPISAV